MNSRRLESNCVLIMYSSLLPVSLHSVVRIRSDPVIFGLPDPDPTCNNGYILYFMPTWYINIYFFYFKLRSDPGFFVIWAGFREKFPDPHHWLQSTSAQEICFTLITFRGNAFALRLLKREPLGLIFFSFSCTISSYLSLAVKQYYTFRNLKAHIQYTIEPYSMAPWKKMFCISTTDTLGIEYKLLICLNHIFFFVLGCKWIIYLP